MAGCGRADDKVEEAIAEAIGVAWDKIVVHPAEARRPWTGLDLATAALEELRTRNVDITRATVHEVLGHLVSDQLLMHREGDALYWLYGNVTLLGAGNMLDALEEVDIGNVVDRAFSDDR